MKVVAWACALVLGPALGGFLLELLNAPQDRLGPSLVTARRLRNFVRKIYFDRLIRHLVLSQINQKHPGPTWLGLRATNL